MKYHYNKINNVYIYMKNSRIIDRYFKYRNQNSDVRRQIMILMNNEIRVE